jgi:hypothetical protein
MIALSSSKATPPKRPRGRPKGARNKPKARAMLRNLLRDSRAANRLWRSP